jgi:hypothetical protein
MTTTCPIPPPHPLHPPTPPPPHPPTPTPPGYDHDLRIADAALARLPQTGPDAVGALGGGLGAGKRTGQGQGERGERPGGGGRGPGAAPAPPPHLNPPLPLPGNQVLELSSTALAYLAHAFDVYDSSRCGHGF